MLILFLLSAPLAQAGVHIGNGGGLSESNFAYAYIKSGSILQGCLASAARCGLGEPGARLAADVLAQLPTEQQTHDQLRFLSSHQHPGFFDIDGVEQTARTHPEVGSLIYINLDHIYPVADDGHKTAVSVDFAVEVLMKQFAFHVDGSDQSVASDMAKKLATFARGRTTILEYGTTGMDYIRPLNRPTMTLVTAVHEVQSFLMLADADTAYELTDLVRARLKCGDLPVKSFTLKQMYWKVAARDHDLDTLFLQMAARSSIRCAGSDTLSQGPVVHIDLKFKLVDGKYRLNADEILVH